MEKLKAFYSNHKNRIDFLLPIFYLIFLILFALQVNQIVNEPNVDVSEPPKVEKKEDRRNVSVTLNIIDQNNNLLKSTENDIENQRSVEDFLKRLREDNELFYEKITFSDGIKLEQVLDQPTPEGYTWEVYLEDKKVTNDIERTTFSGQPEKYLVKLVLEKTLLVD